MRKGKVSQEENKNNRRKTTRRSRSESDASKPSTAGPLINLQQSVGNRAVQRLIAQRSGDGPSEVDDDTAERINRQRGGGQPLDGAMQERMGDATGEDFSQVKVHTDPEADDLNKQLGARAFTTGQDIYFRGGAYQPHTSGGQELLAHELTHVVQQRQGAVGGSSRMTVNDPGDAFERQADDVSRSVTSGQPTAAVQREEVPEEEEPIQAQEEEEEEVQMQEEDEEELVQAQEIEDDDEAMKS